MRPFAYERARRRGTARSPPCADAPGRALPRRRHQPRRPDEARRRDARRCSSTSRACRSTRIEDTADGGLRIGAAVRNSDLAADPLVRERYPLLVAGAARRRLRPAAQPRHHRRQPAAAHALPLLPGRLQALQQARARAPAARPARASTATSRSSAHSPHCVATHPSDMAVALAALDATVHVRGPAGDARIPLAGLPPAARRRARARHGARPRRADHRRRAARRCASPAARATARCATARRSPSRSSRVAAALDVDDGTVRDGRIALGGVAHAPWRAPRAEERAARRAGHAREPCRARPRPSSAGAGRCATTPSRSRWRATCSCAP